MSELMSNPAVTIRVEGELGLPQAAALRHELLTGLEAGRGTVLDLSGVESIDLAGLQLVCSAHRSYLPKGVPFRLCGVGETLRRILSDAGFRPCNRPAGMADECVWRG